MGNFDHGTILNIRINHGRSSPSSPPSLTTHNAQQQLADAADIGKRGAGSDGTPFHQATVGGIRALLG